MKKHVPLLIGITLLIEVIQFILAIIIGANQNIEQYGQLSLRLAYFALLATSFSIITLHIIKRRHLDRRSLFYASILFATFIGITNLDIIAVGRKFDLEQLGYYNSWVQYAKIIILLLTPIAALLYVFFVTNTKRIYSQIIFIISLVVLVAIGVATNLGYGFYGKKLIFMLFGKEFYPINTYLEWAAYYGTGYVMMMVMSFYFLARKSIISLVPALLLPLYVVALIVYPNNIADVMYLNIIYVFLSITIFLLAFFKDRVIFLLK